MELDRLVHKDFKETLVPKVLQVHLAHQVNRVLLGILVHKVLLVRLDNQVRGVIQDHLVHLEHLGKGVTMGPRDFRGHLVPLEILVMLDHLVSKALRDFQVSQVRLDHLETRGLLVLLDSQGHQVLKDRMELKVHLDHQGMQFLDHQDLQASLESRELQVIQEEEEALAFQDQLDQQDRQGQEGTLDRPGLLVHKEILVPLEHQVGKFQSNVF